MAELQTQPDGTFSYRLPAGNYNVKASASGYYEASRDFEIKSKENTALPNSGSNIVIFGHSGTASGEGKYSDIFAPLNKLNKGDDIKINFNQKEYLYTANEKK